MKVNTGFFQYKMENEELNQLSDFLKARSVGYIFLDTLLVAEKMFAL